MGVAGIFVIVAGCMCIMSCNVLEMYEKEKDSDLVSEENGEGQQEARHFIFKKGQSKRLWNELYKVCQSGGVF